MDKSRFFKLLGAGSLLLVAIVYFIHQLMGLQSSLNFSLFSILFFLIFAVIIYFWGHNAALSTNKNAFTGVVMVSIFGKMLLAILLIVVYTKIQTPDSRLFVLPFILVCLYFIAFEAYFLTQLGHIKPTSGEETN